VNDGLILKSLDDKELSRLHAGAVASVQAWSRAAAKCGSLLQCWIRGHEVVMGQRYPDPDITDRRSGYQYFYHSHRHGVQEHGHVHVFYHATASGKRRYIAREKTSWQRTAPTHLIAIGLDNRGLPISLFCVNQWVTDGHWFDSQTTHPIVKRLKITHDSEFSDSSEWITGFSAMYAHVIERLLIERDRVIAGQAGSLTETLQDHNLEVLCAIEIDWLKDVQKLEAEMARRNPTIKSM